ncbi:UDP-2,3-diacylglucosamine diphosphatase [candidate division KSB1 bacterium]|nr:UDP-2,3-diacylglucosamine diphosphatase [candidate division KSB1 bacterium]
MEKVYFISDVHIGAGHSEQDNERVKRLSAFLKSINSPGNTLFIVGDLFDFWFEYKYVVPKSQFNIFFHFYNLIQNGVEVHFLPGNHDYWTRDFFAKEVGFIMHPETMGTTLQGRKVFFFHGDGVSSKDKGYQLLKKIFRNRFNIFLYRWLHPDLGVPLARLTSNTSRHHTANTVLKDEQDYLAFAVDKFEKGYDIVVMGHAHRPSLDEIDGKFFINLGDWISNNSYGVLYNGNLTLEYWNA